MHPLDRKEGSISRSARIVCGLAGTVIVAALVAWYVVGLRSRLSADRRPGFGRGRHQRHGADRRLFGHAPHPDWVSYLVKNEQGQWVHSTIWKVPANSLVRVTVLQYDGDSGLRNPFLGQPRGIIGGTMIVNGKPLQRAEPRPRVAHVHDPRPGRERAARWASPTTRRTSAPSRRARWPRRTTRSRSSSTGQARPPPLAVLRPVRRRLAVRVRRPDADGRLDGRLHQGGLNRWTPAPISAARSVIWVVLAIVADLLIGFLLAPHMPPGHFSNTASDQTEINNILALILTPIGLGVITFFVYALFVVPPAGGPASRTARPMQGRPRTCRWAGWASRRRS